MSTCKSHKSYEFLKATCDIFYLMRIPFIYSEHFDHINPLSYPGASPLTCPPPNFISSSFSEKKKKLIWVPSVLPVYAVVWRHRLRYTQPASGYISKEDWPHPLQITITTVTSRVQGPIKSWRWRYTVLLPILLLLCPLCLFRDVPWASVECPVCWWPRLKVTYSQYFD